MLAQQAQAAGRGLPFGLGPGFGDDRLGRPAGLQVLDEAVVTRFRGRGGQPPPQLNQFFSASSMTLPVARLMASRRASK